MTFRRWPLHQQDIENLSLYSNRIGADGLQCLGLALCFHTSLIYLDYNQIGGMQYLGKGLQQKILPNDIDPPDQLNALF